MKKAFLILSILYILISCKEEKPESLKVEEEIITTVVEQNTQEIDTAYQYFPSDTVFSIKQKGSIKYELVFDLAKERNGKQDFFVPDIYRLDHLSYAGNNKSAKYFIQSERGSIVFAANGIFLSDESIEETQKLNIDIELASNRETIKVREFQLPQEDYFYQRRYHFDDYDIVAKSKSSRCDDTGNNDLLFFRGNDSLSVKSLNNILVWDDDLDGDKLKETYLLDYAICKNQLKIYKISVASH